MVNVYITSLKSHIESLEAQLQSEREANRENRRIIMAFTQRIPELGPFTDTHETPANGPVSAAEESSMVRHQRSQRSLKSAPGGSVS
jgi:hypothetical protein